MGTVSGQERRRDHRHERDDVALRLTFNGRPVHVDQVRDVSPAGFGVQLAQELKVGDAVQFTLEVDKVLFSGSAKVIWIEPFHMGWRGGLQITALGYLARRRLAAAITGERGVEGWLDVILLTAAAVAAALVCVDLAMNPAARANILKQLRILLGR